MKELHKIQQELKAPKGQYNSFGKYKYRSQEDILEGVKPLLAKHNCTLTLSDEIIMLNDRFYVKACATISNGTDSKEVFGWAREPENRKGMDESQITGATSSYARKYALNGLLCIDDTKDADATNDHSSKSAPTKTNEPEKPVTIDKHKALAAIESAKSSKALQAMKERINTSNLKDDEELTNAIVWKETELNK